MKRTKVPEVKIDGEDKKLHKWGLPDIGIPAEVLFHPELSSTEKILFGFIRNLSKTEHGCWASNKWLAGLIGARSQTASNAISKLRYWYFINVEFTYTEDGRQVRRIFVNPQYPMIYKEMVEEGYKCVNNGLLKNLYDIKKFISPSIKKFIRPYKNFNNKIDIEKDIKNKNILPTNESEETKVESTTKGEAKATVEQRNKQYIPLASKLADIIRSSKDVKIAQQKIKSWANEIRKLSETDGVDLLRIETVLDWYADNVGGEYIPVVESGSSLRQKFIRLEAAAKRQGSRWPKKPIALVGTSLGPKAMFRKVFGSLADNFETNCYKRAKALMPDCKSREDKIVLAKALIVLHNQISEKQDKHFTPELRRVLADYSPMSLVSAYINWIENNRHWITDCKPGMFDVSHGLFTKFKNQYAKEIDNLARDPLTGRSHTK